MASNDISLTTGMRSNLLSLQNTVTLLDRTQNRLSSGKKVNTAMDNPVSFFAAQALNARASVIDGLKDAMGQAVQTITAADKGITAISSMIEQAKGIAQSALSAERGTPAAAGSVTGAIRLNDISAVSGYATATITLTGVVDGDIFVLRIDTPPAIDTAISAEAKLAIDTPGRQFQLVPGDMNATAENLKNLINNSIHQGIQYYTAQHTAGTATVTLSKFSVSDDSQMDFLATDFSDNSASITNVVNPAPAADQVEIGGVAFTATTGATGGQSFNISGDNTADMEELAQAINDYAWGDTAFSATVSNGFLNLSKTVSGAAADVASGDFSAAGVVGGGTANMTLVEDETSDELTSLIAQFNTLRSQMTELAADAGYKGKNLLADANLVVKFEGTHQLAITGFDASAAGLDIDLAAWTDETSINASFDQLDTAVATLRSKSSLLSGNLSIISVRQSFSTDMINTLSAGADKLTLADSNEEGANMLMLQTRQSLSTTALSLSAQAAQSVLKLFG